MYDFVRYIHLRNLCVVCVCVPMLSLRVVARHSQCAWARFVLIAALWSPPCGGDQRAAIKTNRAQAHCSALCVGKSLLYLIITTPTSNRDTKYNGEESPSDSQKVISNHATRANNPISGWEAEPVFRNNQQVNTAMHIIHYIWKCFIHLVLENGFSLSSWNWIVGSGSVIPGDLLRIAWTFFTIVLGVINRRRVSFVSILSAFVCVLFCVFNESSLLLATQRNRACWASWNRDESLDFHCIVSTEKASPLGFDSITVPVWNKVLVNVNGWMILVNTIGQKWACVLDTASNDWPRMSV